MYNKSNFISNKIELKFLKSGRFTYQHFPKVHIENLSIIDVLMYNDRNSLRQILSEFCESGSKLGRKTSKIFGQTELGHHSNNLAVLRSMLLVREGEKEEPSSERGNGRRESNRAIYKGSQPKRPHH